MGIVELLKLLLVAIFSNWIWNSYVKNAKASTNPSKQSTSLDDFISSETPIALQGILDNIGPNGTSAWGASDGIVIASPSKSDPDYFFTWTRDAALTFKCLIDLFVQGDTSLKGVIEDYISSQAIIQTVPNLSGSLSNGEGLGEPKFQVDFNAFTGSWGRPQGDGPALRATALIAYARWLVDNGEQETALSTIWPIIQNDLAYVSQYWNQTGFDLWEEVEGSSFFTTAAQYRALVEGNSLAELLGQTCDHCASQFPQILCFLQSFWNEGEGYIISNTNTNTDIHRAGKDANSLLASLHLFDPASSCDDSTFQPCSPRALSNHKVVIDSFRGFYPINNNIPPTSGVAVGRYAEDVYMGGNPWYITTNAAAEQMFSALHQFRRQGHITITSISLPFFQSLPLPPATPELTPSTIPSTSALFTTLTTSISQYADSFLSISQTYTPTTGLLAEQFSGDDGLPVSAENLTWSYASFLTSTRLRSGQLPPSWTHIPLTDECPPPSPPDPAPTYKLPCPTPQSQTISLKFALHNPSTLPESTHIYIVGNTSTLSSWDTAQAIPLTLTTTSPEENTISHWFATVDEGFSAGEMIEYKYIRKTSVNEGGEEERVEWESDPNRIYTVPSACEDMVVGVYDTWR